MMKLLCIFVLLFISISNAKVIDVKSSNKESLKYNEHDSQVKQDSNSVHEIVPVEKNEVVKQLVEHDKDVVVKATNSLKDLTIANEEFIIKYETVLYKEKTGHRMVEIIYTKNDIGEENMVDCFLIGDQSVGKQLMDEIPAELVKTLEKDPMTKLIDSCSEFLVKQLEKGTLHDRIRNHVKPESSILNRGFFDSLLIFPGTKWCGPGDVAHDYDDLGSAQKTDRCCRDHDHCYDYIPARGEKYGLKNRALYTASHCSCDRNFTQCLLGADTFTSNTIGCLYFNLLQTRCFEKNYPVTKCVSYSGWIPSIFGSCQQYEFNTNAPEVWQFFDAKYFNAPASYSKFQPGQKRILKEV